MEKTAPKARILLLENDHGHAELVRRAFVKSGDSSEIVQAETLAQAMQRLASSRFDLILADLILPDGRGTELLSDPGLGVPLVIMTSHGSETIAVESLKAGAFDYLVKSPDTFDSIPQFARLALREWTLINEKKEAERSLALAKQEWEGIFHSIGHSALILDSEHRILAANRAVRELTGLADSALIGRRCSEIFHKDKNVPPDCPMEQLLSSGKKMIEKEIETLYRSFIVTCTPLCDASGRIRKIIHMAMDVTEKKRMEERLRENEERLRQIIRQMPNPVGVFGPDGTLSMINQAYMKMFDIQSEDSAVGGSNMLSDPLMGVLGIEESVRSAFRGDTVLIPEIKFSSKSTSKSDGKAEKNLIQELTLFPVFREKKEIWRVVAIWNNITERKRTETRMKKLLNEQEVMLQEIHHRVKNNLQIISSLHRLQSRKFNDPEILKIFSDTQNRIHSMSLIHEQLYRSKDFAKIDFSEYIHHLIRSLIRSHGPDANRIEFVIDVRNVNLPIEIAIPCGLVVNEIITNALKYAFPGRMKTKGRIEISMTSAKGGWVDLTIGDNGIGLPQKIDIAKTESLGLHLIHLLIEEQIQGKIEISSERGTWFHIRFNRKSSAQASDVSRKKSRQE